MPQLTQDYAAGQVVSTTSLQALNASMFEEIEAAGASMHFEGSGKWGMALALYGQLMAMGLEPEIRYLTGHGTPVWVEACGVAFDFRGALQQVPAFSFWLMEVWIPGMAERFDDLSLDELTADILKAESILMKAFPPVIGSPVHGEPEEA